MHADPQAVTLSSFTNFVYDDEGRYLSYAVSVAGHPELSGTRSYTYDADGRLASASGPGVAAATYGYDAAGNHVGTFHGQTRSAADYDRHNQLTGAGYQYDAEGNPVLYGGVAMAYDAEHHLTRIGDEHAPTFTAGYGPDGLRAWSEAGDGGDDSAGWEQQSREWTNTFVVNPSAQQGVFCYVYGCRPRLATPRRDYAERLRTTRFCHSHPIKSIPTSCAARFIH